MRNVILLLLVLSVGVLGQAMVPLAKEGLLDQPSGGLAVAAGELLPGAVSLSRESDFPGLKLVRSNPVKVGKLQGHRFEYAGPHEGRELQIVQVMTVKDDVGFTLWFVATPAIYKKFSNQAETMIRSFKVN